MTQIRRSILCDPLPDSLRVCGDVIGLECDFRRWILALDALENTECADDMTRIRCVIMLVCPEVWKRMNSGETFGEEFYTSLIGGILRFAGCGLWDRTDGNSSGGRGERAFDFVQDGDLIYASFMEAYGVDLTVSDMHWWKFMALLRNLPPECGFMRVVQLRQCDTSKIEDDSLRRRVRRAKAAVRVRDGS